MIVIGAGSGGLSMALGLHQLGLKVLLIDKSDQAIGGECLNTGCVPSKAFIHVSKLIHNASRSMQFGLQVEGRPSMDKIWRYIETVKDKIRVHENAEYFKRQGLDVELGTARFTGKHWVEVNSKTYFGKKITIATGSKPAKLQVPGVEQVTCYDNESIWSIDTIPSTMLFIGAGPINMELGQAFARLGSKVRIVETADRILNKESKEISDILHRESLQLGMEFYLNSTIEEFPDANTAILMHQQQQLTVNFDILVCGIGRTLDFSELNPEAAGIALEKSGALKLDQFLRTTSKNILAIGDAAGGPQFSHGAELQATRLISNMLSPFKKRVKYQNFSWVTFTEPEIATFGFSEEQLQTQSRDYEKLVLDFEEDDRAVASDYQFGKLILFITKSRMPMANAKLLGGSIIAPNAGEIAQELILAKSAGLGIKNLFNKIYPYPTASRVNKTIVMKKYMAEIKPWMKKIAKLLY